MAELLEIDAPRSVPGRRTRPARPLLQSISAACGSVAVTGPQPSSLDHFNRLLVAVGKHRDRAAFEALFGHFAPRLKSYLLRQGTGRELVEEVVQEAMVNVWRRADTFDPEKASASTWIFTIGRNLWIDVMRKERHPAPDPNDPAFYAEPAPLAHELIARQEDTARLHEAMQALPGEQRAVLSMAFLEGKPHGEVAALLSLPLGTVKSRIRLAMARLRSSLGEPE